VRVGEVRNRFRMSDEDAWKTRYEEKRKKEKGGKSSLTNSHRMWREKRWTMRAFPLRERGKKKEICTFTSFSGKRGGREKRTGLVSLSRWRGEGNERQFFAEEKHSFMRERGKKKEKRGFA